MSKFKFITLLCLMFLLQACGNPTRIIESETKSKEVEYVKPIVENKYCLKCRALMLSDWYECMSCKRMEQKEKSNNNSNNNRHEEPIILLTCIECGAEFEEFDDQEDGEELCEDCLRLKLKKEKLKEGNNTEEEGEEDDE